MPIENLNYRERGGGTTLALLHAFPLSSEMWEPQLAGLADVCRMVAVDMRGFGRTPLGGEAYSLDDLAGDLVDLMDRLGVERFVLGGLSMGGYVALACQRRFDDRLQGLLLADTRAGVDAPAARERRYQTIAQVEAHGTGELSRTMPGSLLGKTTQAQQPELVARVSAWIERTDPAAVIAAQRAMAERPDATAQLATIQVPTLVIVGEEDALSPPAEAAAMVRDLPNAQLALIPRAGHLSNLEYPEGFNRAVRDFMSRFPA